LVVVVDLELIDRTLAAFSTREMLRM
jgi:hypothetical protein